MTVAETDTVTRLERLLDDFGRIRSWSATPATFLESAGYPHLENVASNLLEFFLDPGGSHGLGALFLAALLEPLDVERLSRVRICREVGTENGKRIDLVIECDSHVIGVENKVRARVDNPLDEYRAHLVKEAGQREVALMLLCLHEPAPGDLPADVIVVTYEQLMGRVRRNLGTYAADAPAQFVTFALDFVKTMENLRKGNRMNPDLIDLLAKNKKDAVNFLQAAREVTKELRRMVQSTGEVVTDNLPKPLPNKVNTWFYREDRSLLDDDVVHDVEFPSGSKVAVDASVSVGGWKMIVWQRHSTRAKLSPPELTAWLRQHGVPLLGEATLDHMSGGRVVATTAVFSFDAPLEEIAAHVAQVVEQIARAEAAPGEGPSVVASDQRGATDMLR